MNNRFFSEYFKNALVIMGLMLILAAGWLVSDRDVSAQNRGKPISKAALMEAKVASVKFGIGTTELVRQIRKKGVNFRLTAQVENELRTAKFRPEVIEAVRDNYRGESTVAATVPKNNGAAEMRNTVITPTRTTSATNRVTNSTTEDSSLTDTGSENDQKYDAFIAQALKQSFASLTPGTTREAGLTLLNSARGYADSAMKLDNTRPESYKIYAFTAFLAQNYPQAEKYCQDVIDRGGSVQFDIFHFHGEQPVKEVLYIDDESVSIEYDGGYNVFKYSEILSAQTKGMIPFGQTTAAVFSMDVNRGGSRGETYFVPAFRGIMQDAQLISKIINNNLAKNR